MKNIARMIIFFLIVCLAVWLPAKQQKTQLKVLPQQSVMKAQVDSLQTKVDQLQKELELLKRVIKISGANVEIQSNGSVKIRANRVSIEALVDAQMKGTMITIQSTAQNIIRGMPVMIN